MLSAILNGKGRRLPETIAAGSSLRAAFSKSEDMLTASVFERLAYLDAPVLWKLLVATFAPRILPDEQRVELVSVEFWPMWSEASNEIGKSVEPDVVLRLDVGDPARRIALIVECKLDSFQYPDQWAQEWKACQAEMASSDEVQGTYFLALGGFRERPEQLVSRFTEFIRQKHALEIKAAAASWSDLLKAVSRMQPDCQRTRRVLADIYLALELHGFREFRGLNDLAAMPQFRSLRDLDDALTRWKTPSQARAVRDWSFLDSSVPNRPITHHSILAKHWK